MLAIELLIETGAKAEELLHTLGFKADAHSLLFKLATQPMPNVDDALWIADALLLCDLPFTAEGVLTSIDQERLDSEERQRHTALRSEIRLAQLGGESQVS